LPVALASVTREPFPTDDNKLDKVRADLRRALVSIAHVSGETITADPARAAIRDATTFTGDALGGLKALGRKLDQLADDAARETLPLRGGLVLGAESGRAFPDEVTPPATHDTPPLCTCPSPDGCTHRRY
jgi:hypothetical protein